MTPLQSIFHQALRFITSGRAGTCCTISGQHKDRQQLLVARLWHRGQRFAMLLILSLPLWGQAQVHPLYEGADLKQGEKLMSELQCSACHQRNVGGDGNAIYRPQGRINTAGALRGMVESCNTQLNLGLFPEDVNSIAAVLNRDHYRFK